MRPAHLVVSAGLMVFLASPAAALYGAETRITTNTADQVDPVVSGNYIVYTDSRAGNKDIYLYTIGPGSEIDLTPNTPNDQFLDDIDGVRVVYTNVTHGGSDIILFDLISTMTIPLTSGGANSRPAVQGDHVVWITAGATTANVWLADLNTWTTRKITNDPPYVDMARVDGDWVVWEEMTNGPRQIRAYRISTMETRTLTAGPSEHRWPDVSGSLVVWASNADGNWNIYKHNLTTGITAQVTTDPGWQVFPRISGNRVVWEDSRSGTSQIWTQDLAGGAAEPVSPSGYEQILNSIDGNRIVWCEPRFGNYDIFMFTIAVCGDGVCNGAETCATCPQDCGPCPPICGDGRCNGFETCYTCPRDCGPCPPFPVTINQATGQPDPTDLSPIYFSAVFSRPVTGFTGSDVVVTGTAGGIKTAAVSDRGDHATYDVTVRGMTSAGTVTASIPAGVAQDSNGVANSASTSSDNTVQYTALTVGQAKLRPHGTHVALCRCVVTLTRDDDFYRGDAFYVEMEDRSCGIQISPKPQWIEPGMAVTLTGTVVNGTYQGWRETLLSLENVYGEGYGSVEPVFVRNKDVGGGTFGSPGPPDLAGQFGVTGGVGLNNVGLLLETCGQYQVVNGWGFTVEDGSGLTLGDPLRRVNVECLVPDHWQGDPTWDYIQVTGVVACMWREDFIIHPQLLLQDRDSIQVLRYKSGSISGTITGPAR